MECDKILSNHPRPLIFVELKEPLLEHNHPKFRDNPTVNIGVTDGSFMILFFVSPCIYLSVPAYLPSTKPSMILLLQFLLLNFIHNQSCLIVSTAAATWLSCSVSLSQLPTDDESKLENESFLIPDYACYNGSWTLNHPWGLLGIFR